MATACQHALDQVIIYLGERIYFCRCEEQLGYVYGTGRPRAFKPGRAPELRARRMFAKAKASGANIGPVGVPPGVRRCREREAR